MKTLLAGVAGAFILSALLVSGYLWLARHNLIILSLDRGGLGRKRCHDGHGLRGGFQQGDSGQGSS
jgi:hypothetical protein